MLTMNPLRAVAMSECLQAGQTYLIWNAKRIPTEKGLRLFVRLRVQPNGVLCKLPAALTYLFTDHQIELIVTVGTSTYCTTSSSAPFSAHQSSALSRTRYLCLTSKTALS